MANKTYLDYAGLKRVLKRLLPGARKIWHGTLAEWEALSATEKAKYDQAEVIDDDTGVPVVVDKVESGNLNPVTSNAVAEALDNATIDKMYFNVLCDLDTDESSQVPGLSPTGWFNTNLKVNSDIVTVVVKHIKCYNSGNVQHFQVIPYDVATDFGHYGSDGEVVAGSGNLRVKAFNLGTDTIECTKCRVWFSLIGKAKDLPN